MHFWYCIIAFAVLGRTTAAELIASPTGTPSKCVTTSVPFPPFPTICSQKGTLKLPAVLSKSTQQNQTVCRDVCLKNSVCKSFSFKPAGKVCNTFKKSLNDQNFQYGGTGPTFWDRGCYNSLCCGNTTNLCSMNGEGSTYYFCSNPKNDTSNCGVCGHACTDQQKCFNGKCKNACKVGKKFCYGECVDTKVNTHNCGDCGITCDDDQTCSNGECKDICESGQTYCGGRCLDAQTDFNNCGSCGNQCVSGQSCIKGGCRCPEGQEFCGGNCIQLGTTENCAACGDACSPNFFCNNKQCQCYDPATTQCGNECVDLQMNRDNCGKCGNQCPASSICTNRTCKCQNPSAKMCGSPEQCIDVNTSASNCGDCGKQCHEGEECVGGKCQCTSGKTFCEATNMCTDGTDLNNCGGCGKSCDIGYYHCIRGECSICRDGYVYCDHITGCVRPKPNGGDPCISNCDPPFQPFTHCDEATATCVNNS